MSAPISAPPNNKKLSSYMMTSIAILAVVGFASILLILFGDFENKMGRVASTFVAFVFFTVFTAMDTSTKRPVKSIPLAAFFNIVILSLSLSATWLGLFSDKKDDYDYAEYYSGFLNFFNVIFIGVVGRLGSMAVQKALQYTSTPQSIVNTVAGVSAGSFGIATLLYILPQGFRDADFGDTYWKIAIAFILLAGLTTSILVLLLWFYREEGLNPFRNTLRDGQQTAPTASANPGVTGTPQPETIPANGQETLPWPVFPNGDPLPALPNGRPDFEALQKATSMHIASETKFYQQ